MVLSRIRQLFNNRIAQNAAALYAVQILTYLLPLVTLPYLSRVLDPIDLGLLTIGQSFANWLAVVGEYGFNYSATRSIARQRDRLDAVAGIVMSIMGAKMLLVLGMVLVTLIAVLTVPIFREHGSLAFWALAVAIVSALNPLWYFQAIEKAWFMAVLEVIARGGHLLGIFLLVKSPHDAWLALAAQAVSSAITTGYALRVMYKEIPFRVPTLALSWVALKVSWSLFVARASDSLYTSANGFILGLLAPPFQVGLFRVEQFARAGMNMLFPLAQAIYPRINKLMRTDANAAARLSRFALWATTGMGLVGGAMLFLLAPIIVHILMGPKYYDSIPVLRVLSLLLPLVGFGFSLSMQYMFPRRMDREVLWSVIVAGAVNVLMALILAPRIGAMGMAIAVVSAEAAASVVRFVVLKFRKVL